MRPLVSIGCSDCEVSCETEYVVRDEAIEQWNRRATPATVAPAGEAVAWQRRIRTDAGKWLRWEYYHDEERPETIGRWKCEYRALGVITPPAPAGEAVAWRYRYGDSFDWRYRDDMALVPMRSKTIEPLYTTPPKQGAVIYNRQWIAQALDWYAGALAQDSVQRATATRQAQLLREVSITAAPEDKPAGSEQGVCKHEWSRGYGVAPYCSKCGASEQGGGE